jgi:hypothetical protein
MSVIPVPWMLPVKHTVVSYNFHSNRQLAGAEIARSDSFPIRRMELGGSGRGRNQGASLDLIFKKMIASFPHLLICFVMRAQTKTRSAWAFVTDSSLLTCTRNYCQNSGSAP